MEIRIVDPQFGLDEGVKIIPIEEGLGTFGEVLLVICHAVVEDATPIVEQNAAILAGFLGFLKDFRDPGVVKPKNLIVIGVREFVQDHHGVFHDLGSRDQLPSYRDVDFLGESRVVTIVDKPSLAGMILHRLQAWMILLDPDFKGLELLESSFRNEIDDEEEMILQHLEGPALFRIGIVIDEGRINMDGPAFHFLHHGIEREEGGSKQADEEKREERFHSGLESRSKIRIFCNEFVVIRRFTFESTSVHF